MKATIVRRNNAISFSIVVNNSARASCLVRTPNQDVKVRAPLILGGASAHSTSAAIRPSFHNCFQAPMKFQLNPDEAANLFLSRNIMLPIWTL